MERKKPADVIPPPFYSFFDSIELFNSMQSIVLKDLLHTDKSVVLSAPTGSGKTVAFEFAIIKMLLDNQLSPNTNENWEIIPAKVIYIAPIKALCNEKFKDWSTRSHKLGIECAELTGDTEAFNLMAIRQAQIVISTPEKWDSLTRRWRDFEYLLEAIKLFIVDEVHLLNEDKRGPILETIVARMKSSGVKRFIVASATIPNVEDLTNWMRSNNTEVVQHIFNELDRPVPLEKHIVGVNSKLRGFKFDMQLNYQLPGILNKYSEGKGSLIFCSSRKSAEMAAFNFHKVQHAFKQTIEQHKFLKHLAQQLLDIKLRKLVENGIAYHHAGLQYADRSLIESSFRQGFLMFLFSTSTLAMGINLPAHLVVVKSTETYTSGGYTEYPESTILQMIGRAGRPQYDTKGIAVILTQRKSVQKYQKLMNGKAPIESHLHKHLAEHLNAEIALLTITNLEEAMKWMRSTYLYVRAVKSPGHYGFEKNITKDFIEHKLEELCLQEIYSLQREGLITLSYDNGLDVRTTAFGKLMAKFYLCFDTMKVFRQVRGQETLLEIFNTIIQSKEMTECSLRVNEKKMLNEINKTPIRFPIKGRIKTDEQKISCLIQAVLGNIEIPAPNLIQDSLKLVRLGERVSKCLFEFIRLRLQDSTEQSNELGWYKACLNAVTMAKCFQSKLWENSEFVAKQLHGIGTVYATILANAGKKSLKSIMETDARNIEYLLNKSAPFGDEVLQNLLTFPEYKIDLSKTSADFIQIYIKQVNECYIHKNDAISVLIVGDSFNNLMLLSENLDKIIMEYGYFERTLKLQKPDHVEQVYASVIHTTLVGVDAHAELTINSALENDEYLEGNLNKPTKQTRHQGTTRSFQELLDVTFSSAESRVNLKNFEYVSKTMKSYKNIAEEELNQTTNVETLNHTKSSTNSNDKQRKLTDYFVQRTNLREQVQNTEMEDREIDNSIKEIIISENIDNKSESSKQNFTITENNVNRFSGSPLKRQESCSSILVLSDECSSPCKRQKLTPSSSSSPFHEKILEDILSEKNLSKPTENSKLSTNLRISLTENKHNQQALTFSESVNVPVTTMPFVLENQSLDVSIKKRNPASDSKDSSDNANTSTTGISFLKEIDHRDAFPEFISQCKELEKSAKNCKRLTSLTKNNTDKSHFLYSVLGKSTQDVTMRQRNQASYCKKLNDNNNPSTNGDSFLEVTNPQDAFQEFISQCKEIEKNGAENLKTSLMKSNTKTSALLESQNDPETTLPVEITKQPLERRRQAPYSNDLGENCTNSTTFISFLEGINEKETIHEFPEPFKQMQNSLDLSQKNAESNNRILKTTDSSKEILAISSLKRKTSSPKGANKCKESTKVCKKRKVEFSESKITFGKPLTLSAFLGLENEKEVSPNKSEEKENKDPKLNNYTKPHEMKMNSFSKSKPENLGKCQQRSDQSKAINEKSKFSLKEEARETLSEKNARLSKAHVEDWLTKNSNYFLRDYYKYQHILKLRKDEYTQPLDLKISVKETANEDNILRVNPVRNFENMKEISSALMLPTDKEFSLWYKVAMQFQRLPSQALSMSNFRKTYEKVTQENQTQVEKIANVFNSNRNGDRKKSPFKFRESFKSNNSLVDNSIIDSLQEVEKQVLSSPAGSPSSMDRNYEKFLQNSCNSQ